MTVWIEEEDNSEIAICLEDDGRIKIERKDESGGCAMWFDRDIVRRIAVAILGITEVN